MMTRRNPLTQEFSHRLGVLMDDRGLSQADLARLVWGSTKDNRGYVVARNRDRISVYLKGNVMPDRKNLQALAAALGVQVTDLVPHAPWQSVDLSSAPFSITEAGGRRGMVQLRVDRVVSLNAATKIAEILMNEMAGAGGANSGGPRRKSGPVGIGLLDQTQEHSNDLIDLMSRSPCA